MAKTALNEYVHYLQHFLMFISAVFFVVFASSTYKKKIYLFSEIIMAWITNHCKIIFNTQAKYIYVKINQGLLLDYYRSKNWWFNYVDYRQYDVFNDSSNYTVCIF